MITDYTTYDDIRAALGVESEEISDATLGLTLYSSYLDGELEDIDFTLPTVYQTLKYLRIVTRLKLNHVKNFEAKPLVFYRPRMVREPCRRILRDTEPYVFFGIGKYVYRVEASRVFRVESIVRA